MYQIPPANQRMIAALKQMRVRRGDTHQDAAAPERFHSASYSPTVLQPATGYPATRTKQQEFPHIDWDDTLNPDIQLCQLLYNERVRTYQKMQQMLGEASGAEQANSGESLSADFGKQFARLDDSNRQAQAELENYNALQRFLRIHPITKR